MKAIILAAGKGERLQPFTNDIPKSLLRIDDQTILENQINHLKKCDIEEINVVVIQPNISIEEKWNYQGEIESINIEASGERIGFEAKLPDLYKLTVSTQCGSATTFLPMLNA